MQGLQRAASGLHEELRRPCLQDRVSDVSEVVQSEEVGAGRDVSRMAIPGATIAAGLLTVLALGSGSALAEDPKKLSGTQIRAKFSDRQLTDEVHWREVYQRDGTFRSYSMGRVRTGTWFVHSDDHDRKPCRGEKERVSGSSATSSVVFYRDPQLVSEAFALALKAMDTSADVLTASFLAAKPKTSDD